MKLTSWSELVKLERAVLTVAIVTSLLCMAMLALVLAATDQRRDRMARFGSATVRILAELAVEPLMKQDRMHLGVLGNRLAEIEEVTGVASYSVDNQLLASTGDLQGPQYTEPVIIDDSIVGYVRIALSPQAFAEENPARTLTLLLAALLIPFAVAAGWSFAAAARSGRLPHWPPRWPPRRVATPAPPEYPEAATAEPETVEAVRHYLLAVNLYNQLSLQPTEREFELSLCIELAEAVAGVYQGQVVALPGVGALVDFDHTDEDDRPFHILCAAFALARLLREEAPFGIYRLGLNLAEVPADRPLPLDDDSVADASLLSALAKDMTLALSAPYAEALGGLGRTVSQPLLNPLLDELVTSSPGCHLVTELEPPYAALVVQQAERLRSQRDAISSESTF